MFQNRKYNDADQKKWRLVLEANMMSSEESGDEDELYVKPLTWRADRVNKFLMDLDDEFHSSKSAQAKRQTKQRIHADKSSQRPIPPDLPAWVISEQ